ncbi:MULTISPECIES: DsbA family protein [unclassified Pantoea]|uniref:DsbA family protein n=1 Tax=unclassified Pantoea TaxID=2630326 RepID=UPI00301D2714
MLKIFLASMMLIQSSSAPAQDPAGGQEKFLRVPVSGLVAFTPERAPETEALIRSNLLHDPHSPRIGAQEPALTLVCFTDYNGKDRKALDAKLHSLLARYPKLAVTYKLNPAPFQPLNPARMSLTMWESEPDKFDAFHQALMRYQGVLDDYSIRRTVRDVGGHIYQISPEATHTLASNKALMKQLHITHTPATLVGETVFWGDVPFDELESAVKRELKDKASSGSYS